MLLEQTAKRRNAGVFYNQVRILKLAIGQPDLDDAKVLFGRNSDAINILFKFLVFGQDFAHQRIGQCAPYRRHGFITHFIRETTPVSIFRILPHGLNTLSHEEEHAVVD